MSVRRAVPPIARGQVNEELVRNHMPPRLYSSVAKAIHHWYLGSSGAWNEEDTQVLLALRARGLTWAQIGEEMGRYKEEVRPPCSR